MTLTIEHLDRRLAYWRQTLDRASQNLIDLHSLPTYQRLTQHSHTLTGTTQSQVLPALDGMTGLFQHFELLVQTIERASNLRKQVSRWNLRDPAIDEAEALLMGPSIRIPTPDIPLVHRSLVTAAELHTAIAPEQLLKVMTIAFEQARDVVLAVDRVWSTLEPELFKIEQDVEQWQAKARSFGLTTDFATLIAQARQQIDSDPLGAQHLIEQELQPAIAYLKTTIEQTLAQEANLRSQLDAAYALLDTLRDLRERAIAAYDESSEKVVQPTVRPAIAAENIDALSQWLSRLEIKFEEKKLQPVSVGLQNWIVNTKTQIDLERQTLEINRLPVETRRELRGRLSALQAKALAYGLIEDRSLSECAAQANQILYTRPTDLQHAEELLKQYEKHLNQR